jgi:hypothetical protein
VGIHRHLKRWFVPHKQNDHRPHLIRGHGLAIMAVLILGVQVSAFTLSSASLPNLTHGHVLDYATDITPLDLLAQTNQQRADNGLPALTMNAQLNDSASMKAADMFAEDYWAHVSPSGIQPWYWFTKAGYNYSYAGENLAKDFATTSGVMAGWMNSPGHRANILNPHYIDVGFAVENGTLVGGETTLVVAHYAAPAQTAVVVAAVPSTPAPVASVPAKITTPPITLPAATPVSTPTSVPTVLPSPHSPVVASGQISPGEPSAKSYSLFDPLSLTRTAPIGTLVTIILLLILLFVYAYTHMTVWRKGLKRWRRGHYRLYAAAQLSGLTVVILMLAASGFGKVG